MFAGQGAQVVGMGKDLAERYPDIYQPLAASASGLGIDLVKVCFEGPEDRLTRTEYAQPGIYFISWLAFQVLKHQCPALAFEATAGLSLGEFTALAAGGAFSFEDGLKLVHQRGIFMQEACDVTRGTMAAVIGLDRESTRAVCQENGVELANLNCPGQLVISGEVARVEKACEQAKARGAKKAMVLPVAGAYHSRLMESAKPKLAEVLDAVPIQAPALRVMSNVNARPHGEPAEIRARLVDQVTSSVRWEESILHLIGEGFDTFIELGPGKALSTFVKRIDRGVAIHNVADLDSLEKTAGAINNA